MASTTPSKVLGAALALALSFTLVSCGSRDGSSQTGSLLNGTGSTAGQDVLRMVADQSTVQAGGEVQYAVTVRNTTPLQLQTVEVNVTVPSQKLAVTDAGGGTLANGRITWSVPALAAGQVLTFGYTVTLNADLSQGELVRTVVSMRAANLQEPATAAAEVHVGTVESEGSAASSVAASVTSSVVASVASSLTGSSSSVNPGYSFFLGNQSSSASSVIATEKGSLALAQNADQAERQTGTRVVYTITVRNTSAVPLSTVTVQALLPPPLFVTNVGGGVISGNTLTWNITSLLPGATRTFTYRASVRTTAKDGDVISTIAQVSSPSLSTPLATTTDIRVVGRMPMTGAEDRFFEPLDAEKYLTPVR